MSRAVRANSGIALLCGIALVAAPGAPAAAEEKSTKPRIAVIEFKDRSHGQIEIEGSQWGEWIADVERPRAMGSWSKASGLGVSWGAPASRGSTGAKEKITIHGRPTESAPTRGSGGDPDRPVIAGSVPNASAATVGAARSLTVGGARTLAAPLPRGSITLRLKQPWAGCAVGDRFDGVFVMTGVTHGYRLGGAEVARCDGRAMTINYTMFAAEGTPVR